MLDNAYYAALGLSSIREKVLAGERLTPEDGLALFRCSDITAVGALALHDRCRRHGHRAFYVVNRQINYTNVCVNGCTFCAFRRDREDEPGAFALSIDDVLARLREADAASLRLDELHIVGGCHPTRPLAWFEELLRAVRACKPDLPLKAFTPVEIAHFAQLEGISTLEVLQRLKAAGLVMMPGGGAEIFDEQLRREICPHKADAAAWLRISGEAHSLGIVTNCTMLFGHLETYEQRIDHLCRLRAQQDKSGGFTCFIPLPFLTENSRLKLPDENIGPQRGLDQLRTIAVSRLMLDNIPHIKAYWIMLGHKLAPTALWYGADDLDGTIIEERIGHMAGAGSAQGMTIAELEHVIRKSGFTPVRRNATFKTLERGEGDAAKERAAFAPFAPARSAFTGPADAALDRAVDMASKGHRLDRDAAEALYYRADLHTLAHLAHAMRLRLHPAPVVTYVGDRNINYSNICVCGCRFCAFFRAPGEEGGYVISREEMARKIDETLALGGTQVLLQGGHHPDLPLEWYEDLLRWMRATWPALHIHAFSPPEIFFWSKKFGLPVAEVLRRLREAGLHSVPGGGAEILETSVRARVSPNKCTAEEWLNVMEEAHKLGMRTTATMMFGHEEEPRHRLDHLFAVRDVQDRTHGFTAFIPWTFQPAHTRIHAAPLPAPAYLRLLAVARLTLDNVPNIQASWVTMGPQAAQLALFYGANDFGSLMIEENVVAAAGVSFRMSRRDIHKVIRAAGFTPVQRAMDYRPVDPQPEA